MERKTESKGYNEMYKEQYTDRAIFDNPLTAAEAMGYLKCLSQFLPSERWIEAEKVRIICAVLLHIKEN